MALALLSTCEKCGIRSESPSLSVETLRNLGDLAADLFAHAVKRMVSTGGICTGCRGLPPNQDGIDRAKAGRQ